MRWLREHKLFSIISIIVVALLIMIGVSYLSAGGTSVIGSTSRNIISAIEKPISSFSAGVKSNIEGIFKYKKIQKENKQLKDQVEKLENENTNLKLNKDEMAELKSLSKSLDFKPFVGVDEAVVGQIIALDNSKIYNSFTIDVGKDKGIKKDDIVVDGNGIVGKIESTAKDNSKVISIIDSNSKISFQLKRNRKILGVLKGDGNNSLKGYLLDNTASVVEGDVLLTSGVGLFPKGIKIGKIEKIEFDRDTDLKIIEVKPTVNFYALQKVAVYK